MTEESSKVYNGLVMTQLSKEGNGIIGKKFAWEMKGQNGWK